MAIITISRQNGSLGDEIADALASRLGTIVVSRKYALDNFFGEINPGTLDRLNESAKFFDLTLPGSDRTYADILVERIHTRLVRERPLRPRGTQDAFNQISSQGGNLMMRIKPNRKRTIEFKVMLSPEEAELLKKKSEESGLSRSEVLRSLLIGRSITGYRDGSTTPSHFGQTIRKDGN